MIISDWSSDVFSSDLEVTVRVIEGYDYLKPPRIDDFIVRLSPDGRELSKTWLIGAMAASPWGKRLNIVPWYVGGGKGDYLHTNAVDVIEGGTEKMPGVKPGDLLLSFREISTVAVRSEERRVGQECVSTGRSWWSPEP